MRAPLTLFQSRSPLFPRWPAYLTNDEQDYGDGCFFGNCDDDDIYGYGGDEYLVDD